MKNLPLILLLAILHVSTATGQTYSFQHFSEPYIYLTGDSSISENIPWYNETWEIPIGFNFKFMGHDFDHLTAWNENLYFDFENEDMFIFPYVGAYLLDKGFVTPGLEILSPISIIIEGNPGSKIFKFQCRNAGFEEGGPQDSVNFQIWLHETSNIIEFHYGPKNIVSNVWYPGFNAPGVGFLSFSDDIGVVTEDIRGWDYGRKESIGYFVGLGACPNLTAQLALLLEVRFLGSPSNITQNDKLEMGYNALNINIGVMYKPK